MSENSKIKKTANKSSGAEKVELIDKKGSQKSKANKNQTANNDISESLLTEHNAAVDAESKPKKRAASKKARLSKEERLALKAQKRAEKESARAKLRASQAKARADKRRAQLVAKAKRADERRLKREERGGAKLERKRERAERRLALANESKSQRAKRLERERAAKRRAALERRAHREEVRQQKRQRRLEQKQKKRETRGKRERREGAANGGWLAAVISLGVVTLALGTIVTVGFFEMGTMRDTAASSYTATVYELVGLSDNIDTDLSKLKVSNGVKTQQELLTDVLVQSELAESALGRLPVQPQNTEKLTSFINKMRSDSRKLLARLADGTPLTDSEKKAVDYMYNVNGGIKSALNETTLSMTEDDMLDFMSDKTDGKIYSFFTNAENLSVTNDEEAEGPFFEESKNTKKAKAAYKEVNYVEGKEYVSRYFKAYGVQSVSYRGEAIADTIACFNYEFTDDKGRTGFVQLSKQGGRLVMFDLYEECQAKNFDESQAVEIAKRFLSDLDINNMSEVWISSNGTVANINFACEHDGVVVYSDLVKVKVCMTKGVVVGVDATAYVNNHTERQPANVKLTMDEAKAKLAKNVDVTGTRLAVIPVEQGEAVAYEFAVNSLGKEYVIYIDASSGEEQAIYAITDSSQGRVIS